MALTVQQIRPMAHLPLILGVLRRLEVATVIERLIAPHPAHVLSTGRGVEALVVAILDERTRNEFRVKVARDNGFWVQGTLRVW